MAIIDPADGELFSTAASTFVTPKALSWPMTFLLISMMACGQAFIYAARAFCAMSWKALDP
jgi:hypothetical protein